MSFILESKHMMQIFLDFVYASNNKMDFFNDSKTYHEFKLMTVEALPVSVGTIKDRCNQILAETIELKTKKGYALEEFIQLINICLENMNVKKINMQFWEDISFHIVKTFSELMIDPNYSKSVVEGLMRVFLILFGYDMKIKELS